MTRPLTMDETAEALNVSRRWFQDFIQTIDPCWLVAGRRKLFDEAALHAVREAMRCHTNSSRLSRGGRGSIGSGGRKPGSTLTEALRLATAGKRKSSSSNGATRQNVMPFPGARAPRITS